MHSWVRCVRAIVGFKSIGYLGVRQEFWDKEYSGMCMKRVLLNGDSKPYKAKTLDDVAEQALPKNPTARPKVVQSLPQERLINLVPGPPKVCRIIALSRF